MLLRFLAAVVVIALLVAAYVWLALQWSYSSGERAGWVQKFSHKGWVCKTWEGELALVSLPGTSVEKFYFTVRDDAVARRVSAATGTRVTLHYEEKVGLPSSCFGDTRYFVTAVTATSDIPIGPGVVVPRPIQPSTPSAAPSSPEAALSPAATASSTK
jgi:hypothetical protein